MSKDKDKERKKEEKLVYTDDRSYLLKKALEKGLSTQKIVDTLTRNESYEECLAIAKKWAPELGISVAEFMKFARGKN